jgi:hypothetical protein
MFTFLRRKPTMTVKTNDLPGVRRRLHELECAIEAGGGDLVELASERASLQAAEAAMVERERTEAERQRLESLAARHAAHRAEVLTAARRARWAVGVLRFAAARLQQLETEHMNGAGDGTEWVDLTGIPSGFCGRVQRAVLDAARVEEPGVQRVGGSQSAAAGWDIPTLEDLAEAWATADRSTLPSEARAIPEPRVFLRTGPGSPPHGYSGPWPPLEPLT